MQFDVSQQFHHLFWFGDLNYRVELPFAAAVACAERHTPEFSEVKGVAVAEAVAAEAVAAEAVAALLATDQLRREMREGRAFAGFSEVPISFALPRSLPLP